MDFYIGNTDYQWYTFLSERDPEDINFWQPGGLINFRAIKPGAPFLLRLKSPVNKIAGIGFFASHSILPIHFAWEVFKERNGIDNYYEFYNKIKSYRTEKNSIDKNPNVGCIVLTDPIFFDRKDWIPVPENWSKSIQQGKTYSTETEIGRKYWNQVQDIIKGYSKIEKDDVLQDIDPGYDYVFTKVRIGQGAFRVMVTDAYARKCAITGEKTLPVLEAAHIKPYSISKLNKTSNGLLLRADLHKLFDSGYITVTKEHKVEISKKIKEEFENGREYYRYHGNSLIVLPRQEFDMPDREYLEWHNEKIYRG